ncbi:MAG: hypothetical protein Q7R35_12090 [Elusimicrobiota bacterium]|nr:hypothetical protein [Elusimicrobiota bacterium]
MDLKSDLWCEGLPLSGRKRLSDKEAADLRRRVGVTGRRLMLARWIGRLGFSMAGLGLSFFILLNASAAREQHPDASGLTFAAALFGPGLLGTLQEIFVGFSRLSRRLFAAVLVVLALGVLLSSRCGNSGLSDALQAIGFLSMIFGGWSMLFIRWNNARKLGPVLEQAAADAESAEILEFSDERVSPRRLEVLPLSRFAYRVNGRLREDWEICRLVLVAAAPAGSIDVPWQHKTEDLGGEAGYLQRHLTEEEIAELSRLSSRMVRKAFVSLLTATWFSALAFRLIEDLINRKMGGDLSWYGWVCAGLAGTFFFGKYFLAWRRLKADSEQGLMVKAKETDGSTTELLPLSGIVWSAQGAPAPWRTSWW